MITFSFQRLVHWLDVGGGRKVLAVLAMVVFVLLFSAYHSYKRFAGPASEYVIEEALVGKHLAAGGGFSTSVIFPQTVSLLEERHGFRFDADELVPDLYHAPLYPIAIAVGLLLIPETLEVGLWKDAIFVGDVKPTGFNADYLPLIVNLIFFWLGCFLVYVLGKRLFSPRVGLVSLFGVFLSVGIWDQVLAISGMSILLFLVVGLFLLWEHLERIRISIDDSPKSLQAMVFSTGVGLVAGLLFLTEYTACIVFLVYVGYTLLHFRRTALLVYLLPAIVGFLLAASPWIVRNIYWTGHPVGLAGQNIALRVGDTTAEPATFRKAMDSSGPVVSLRKIGNKGFKGIEDNLKEYVWSGGAYFFTTFFLTGCLYRFRNPATNSTRWCAVVVIMALILFQPFFSSGESERLPAFYFSPLIIIFGTGFFFVMLESTGRRTMWPVIVACLILLILHSFPLAHNLLEPRRVHFTYPPYVPSILVKTRTLLTDNFEEGFGIMSDIPAGTSWYSKQSVWAQPEEYSDFVKVLIRQNMGALFLSPQILNKPYFTSLLRADLDIGVKYRETRYWGVVYGGLQDRRIPRFFPLQQVEQLSVNMYVLLNPLAWKPKKEQKEET